MIIPKLKIMNWFVRLITLGWAAAITLCPWGIYFKEERYLLIPRIVNHEKIHWKQQLEMLIIGFYIWYGIEFLIRLIIWIFTFFSKNWLPYNNLSFEREAHNHDDELDYLTRRKKFSWMKYIFHKKFGNKELFNIFVLVKQQ